MTYRYKVRNYVTGGSVETLDRRLAHVAFRSYCQGFTLQGLPFEIASDEIAVDTTTHKILADINLIPEKE